MSEIVTGIVTGAGPNHFQPQWATVSAKRPNAMSHASTAAIFHATPVRAEARVLVTYNPVSLNSSPRSFRATF
jgi:hypothetical protein